MALTDKLTNIADAIRSKTETNESMTLDEMPSKIQNIETKSEPNLQDKSIILTENGTTNIVADEGYDALNNVEVTTNIIEDLSEELTDYNAKLTTQKSSIQDIITALETKVAGARGATLNIFMQETEPEIKKGIWLQSNENHDVISTHSSADFEDSEPSVVGDIPTGSFYCVTGVVGEDIYIYGGSLSATGGTFVSGDMCKFNVKTNKITQLKTGQGSYMPRIAIVGDNIYIFIIQPTSGSSDRRVYKYSIANDTYTTVSNLPSERANPSVVAVGTDIYIIGGRDSVSGGYVQNTMFKYNTLNDSYSTLQMPFHYQGTSCIAIGTDIYIFRSNTSTDISSSVATSYKYDTLSGKYTQIADFPTSSMTVGPVTDGTNIYFLNSAGKSSYIYDTLTNTYTERADITSSVNGWGFGLAYSDGSLYHFGGCVNSVGITTIYKTPIETKEVVFEKNTLVIIQNETNTMKTELIENIKNLLIPFNDIRYYNIEDGFIDTIPTYYGDGKQWIKFKN